MSGYFARRLLLLIPTFIGITFLVFAVTRFVPGGPIDQMIMATQAAAAEAGGAAGGGLDGGSSVDIPDAVLDELNKQFGFDKPFYLAYVYWLGDVLTGDLGKSYKYNEPVLGIIVSRFPISIYFGLIGFTLAYLVCVPLGIAKAVKHGSTFDFVSSAIVFVGYSVPGWALGMVLLVFFGGGSFLDLVPLGGFRSDDWDDYSLIGKVFDQLHHTILPVISYSVASFATLTVLMKNSLMENLGQDYVRTAFAKGLSERRVILVHTLRNSLIPICTGLGHALGLVMAGSYLIEFVFNIDGVGYLGYTSIIDRDYAVVMGILVINTLLILLGNILSDVLYVLVDPRIRFS
ncbi:MAG: ABC transporter permease subunit [Myxococcales bacterium]|nr:ABC transporter permease subunit [Myxococcales bacterium]